MNSRDKILKLFFENPTARYHIRELARITKLNPNTIINIANELEKEEIIIREKKKHLVEISGNTENPAFVKTKRIFNLTQIQKSGLIEFLQEKYSAKAISLIGSYSRGEDIEKSDIDIVIISNPYDKSINLSRYEKIFNRKIQLIITDYKNMSDEFYINLINGIILSGYLNKK